MKLRINLKAADNLKFRLSRMAREALLHAEKTPCVNLKARQFRGIQADKPQSGNRKTSFYTVQLESQRMYEIGLLAC